MSQSYGRNNRSPNRNSTKTSEANAPQPAPRKNARPLSEQEYRRMRARKAQKMKKLRRRRRMLLLGLLVIGVLVYVFVSAIFGVVQKQKEKKAAAEASSIQESESIAEVEAESQAAEEDAKYRETLPDMGAIYGIAVNNVGWSHFFADNSYSMAPNGSFITAIRATLNGQPEGMSGTIRYKVNLSGTGWLDWKEDGNEAGDAAGTTPLEGIAMELTGDLGKYYQVLYSVLQDSKWTDWVSGGAEAGAVGVGLHVDGVRISVVKKTGGEVYAGNIDPTRPMVALTYDDGPSSTATPRILKCLQDNGGRATFFMVGKQVVKSPDVLKQMVAQGCEVANHTYDHTLMTKVSPSELANQLVATNQVVSDACGISPVLMRPCGGAKTDAGMNIAGAISMPAILWSIDTLDWKTRDASQTITNVLDNVKDGDIILMHDLYESTAEASETIIPELVSRGFQLVTVSELSSYRGGMIPGKSYSQFRPQS